MSFTPGPWFQNGDGVVYDEKSRDAIAEVNFKSPITNVENSRLIAAAPELLEALESCFKLAGDRMSVTHEIAVKDLIAKARGEGFDMKYFPAELEMKLLITDGESFGVATIGLGHGASPSNLEIQERIEKFEREELSSKQLEGYRLATASEYWDYICTEKSGQTFACPAEWREFSKA